MTEALSHLRASVGRAIWGPSARAVIEPYGIGTIGVALALGVRTVLAPVLEGAASYLFYVPAILVASALGGWGPGVFATFLGLLIGLFFVADYRALTAADIVNAFVFVLVGVGASWRGELLRRSRADAAASAQQALARETHMKLILDTIPDAMIVIDERGIMQSFSAAAERLFGYSAAEVVGKNVKILMPTPYRESHDAYLDRYKLTGDDLAARALRRRDENRSAVLFHRLYSRSHRAAEDRSAPPGAAIRAGACFALDRDGRNGIGPRA